MGELNISKSDTHATPSTGFQKLYPKTDGRWYTKSDTGSEESLLSDHAHTHESGGVDELIHQALSGSGTNTHEQIDTHISSTNNPHDITKAQVGLANVTDDAQLKRAAGDFATFTAKATPVPADIFLVEDSEATNNKKSVTGAALFSVFAPATKGVTNGDLHDHNGGDGAQIDHVNLANKGTNTHSQIDTHLGSISNPHSVTKTQVGLGNVTDDAQLKRAASDFTTFTEKTVLVGSDLVLLEDSADSNTKKKVQISNIPGRFKQSVFTELTANTTTTSITFVELFSVNITTEAGYLLIHFTASGDNTNNDKEIAFRLVIDDIAKRATSSITRLNISNSASLVYKQQVSAGSHVVKIEWKVSANTARILPITRPDDDHASLLVNEVSG